LARSFDLPDRRRIHNLGGTEMLIRLGLRNHEGWWRKEGPRESLQSTFQDRWQLA
jgi:hypothetical protein